LNLTELFTLLVAFEDNVMESNGPVSSWKHNTNTGQYGTPSL